MLGDLKEKQQAVIEKSPEVPIKDFVPDHKKEENENDNIKEVKEKESTEIKNEAVGEVSSDEGLAKKPSLPQRPSQEDPPPRPPPPKIFGPEDDPSKAVELPPAPEDEPKVTMGKRNPKLYQLVAMSQENASCSFWWDSVDANAVKEEEDVSMFSVSFDDSVSVRVVQDEEEG